MAERKGGVADESEEDKLAVGSSETSESIEEIDAKEIDEGTEDGEISIEMVSSPDSDDSMLDSPTKRSSPEDSKLAGWLKLAGVGFRKGVKPVWFVYGDDTGKLYYYRQPQDLLPLGEIDLRSSSLTYDASNRDKPGLFEIRSGGKVYNIDAGDRVHMLFWLDALQKKRRAFSLRQSSLAQDVFMGKKKQLDASGLLGRGATDLDKLSVHSVEIGTGLGESQEQGQEGQGQAQYWSMLNLRTEIRNVVATIRSAAGKDKPGNPPSGAPSEDWSIVDERPEVPNSLELNLHPSSQNKSKTQWHVNFEDEEEKQTETEGENLDITKGVQSEASNNPSNQSDTSKHSATQPSSTQTFPTQSKSSDSIGASQSSTYPTGPTSPLSPNATNGKSKFMSALRNNFKIMKESVKEKNLKISGSVKQQQSPVTQSPGNVAESCIRCRVLGDDLFSVKEDLKAAEEELHANREIVRLLQKELDVMRAEMNTRKECDGKGEDDIKQTLRQKDKHIVELEHSRAAIMEEKSMLAQELRLNANELRDLRERISMFEQTLAVKDEMIISLTNQNQELKNNNSPGLTDMGDNAGNSFTFASDPVSLAAERKEMERLNDTCQAFEIQNKFLTKEILELNALRQDDEMRAKLLKMNVAKLEAQYYQTRSKYLYLLNEKQIPVRGGDENKSQEVVNQLLQEALESEANESQEDVNRQAFISSQGKEYDHYGFLKCGHEDEDVLVSRANMLQRQSMEIGYMIRDADEQTSKRIKWENFMVGQSANKPLTRSPDLKALIRLGIPREFRERIWKGCIDMHVRDTRLKLGPKYYKDLEERAYNTKSNPAIKQIELDLLRTLPDNRFFEKIDSPGIQKLRRILLCYSIHNPCIGYCQGLNRIAAIALLFLCEEDAFWCLEAIIEHLMPRDYYTTTLAAAQADQRVLKDLIQDKCPKLYAHLDANEVDLSLFTFNWFLTVFVDGVHPDLFLRVWDVFLYEGSKILFRYALAFLKYAEEDILKQSNNLAVNRYMRTLGETITDVKRIHDIAFSELNPFPMRSIASKRHYHVQQVKLELEELETIRKDLRSAHEEENRRRERQGYISEDDLDDDLS